ncbi:MAG: 4'-phosphopantetheinyl transferase superfamily protein [Deltaproteobacteria bacterium]|nr:4'-phosphopantetheinyl transferase superfamily protein [Deltaproteobacteria bacterium]
MSPNRLEKGSVGGRPRPGDAPAPGLGEAEIHIWSVPLDLPAAEVASLGELLDPEEMKRALRFRFDRHRRRFIVGRGTLRKILGAYLGEEPRDLAFAYGPKGKPSLDGRFASSGICFNLSHSSELALYGLTLGGDLGVDVEFRRPMPDAEQIAERFFSQSEKEALREIPQETKSEAFFNCWTRKEAYIKATGDGLSMPLDRFDVTLTPGEEARMLRAEGSREKAENWSMFHLEPAEGYVAAVAIPGHGWRLVQPQSE